MSSIIARLPRLLLLSGTDLPEKILSIAGLFICLELVVFKFLPDLSTALIQNTTSALADYGTFERYYLTPGSVHYARFLGNRIMISTAHLLGHLFHAEDLRLHPMRLAAGVLTPLYAYFGAILAIQSPGQYSWRYFILPYSVAVVFALYAFYPGDMPSFALLSITLYCLLRERLGLALAFMLLTGLFRESSLHAVFFVFAWALCARSRTSAARIVWVVAFSAAFAIEYRAIRHFFPGPISSEGGLVLNLSRLLFERGLYSLTTICSLGLSLIFALACLLRLQNIPATDWRRGFFRLNCFAFPLWVIFYRMLGGNISEFRLMLPAILPYIYGIAYSARTAPLPRDSNDMELRTG